ncbi:hypothetical protein CspHIS471_0602040 [Cutaneotrichosporon sp. HIS471]|nr:hypothetical protein CspHIS471_0602040 [Cutaneotrichosporon sp. HIS471]
MLTPPYHFSIVAAPIAPDGEHAQILYRGSIPAARNASFLRRLGIRTLVYLRKKEYKEDDPLVVWAGKQGIDLRWVKAEKMEEETLGMEPEHVTDVLKILLNPVAYPIYLADVDGISHTTLVVACLRKLQGWHSECIVNEIYRFEPDHDDLPLVPFITSYLSTSAPSKDDSGALALPPPPYPTWLWPQPATIPTGSRSASIVTGRSERALSSVSNASNTSGSLPFPNPLMVRRHPSMRLGFSNVPAQLPDKAPGLWRERSNTAASRAVSDKPRTTSQGNTFNSRSDSGDADDRLRLPHHVSFSENVPSGILTRSPIVLPSNLRHSNELGEEEASEVTEDTARLRSTGTTVSDGDDGDDYALDDAEDESIDDDGDYDEEYEDEDEDDEDEEDDEEEEEPPVSQYISALDLAGM